MARMLAMLNYEGKVRFVIRIESLLFPGAKISKVAIC
jgi:hypothetical protein